ncbi:MAG: penicillin-insensitive murein endopeptidase [Ancalomicrobiaceae bacterium]|nr:penicillin-insensitive murein endopeptidase [Ancalomicrobiaceae bacterium]
MPCLRRLFPILSAALLLVTGAVPALSQASGTESARAIEAAKAKLPPDSAKVLFGSQLTPAPLEARSIGTYARGCLAGAVAMPVNGPDWQVMRLSRNRNWGHPSLVAFLERFAAAAQTDGWPGLLVGDMGQPRGGPMLTGHASHQIGLDADIWLLPMPDRVLTPGERETISAVSVVKSDKIEIDPKIWSPLHQRLIRRAALDPAVARIFVNPAIKKALCESAGTDRGWLTKVRPWYGHNYHFHVRLACPPGMADCHPQEPPPAGDGCGKDLAWWLGPEPYKPEPPSPPKPPLKLADLPAACAKVLDAR